MPRLTATSVPRLALVGLPLLAGAVACGGSSRPAPSPAATSAPAAASSAATESTAAPVPSAVAAASIASGTQQCGTISFAAPTPLVAGSVVAKHVSCIDAGKVVAGALGKKGGAYEVAPFRCPAAVPHTEAGGSYDYSCTSSSGAAVTFTVSAALARSTASATIS